MARRLARTLGLLAAVLSLGHVFVPAPCWGRSLGHSSRHAEEKNAIANFFKPRMGKGTVRDLPANAEMIGTYKIVYEALTL